MKKIFLLTLFCFGLSVPGFTHCEIPCGLYDDAGTFQALEMDVQTIEKSMLEINSLSSEAALKMNQIVRWVNNKEEHADKIKTVVAEYFLSQRIKKPEERDPEAYNLYLNQLEALHGLVVEAMKAKQTSDVTQVSALREALEDFRAIYYESHEEMHVEEAGYGD